MSAPEDLALLPTDIAESANIDENGEVWWHTAEAGRAINALADAGLVILGLDMRKYDDTGTFVEWAWSDYRPSGRDDVASARSAALAALDRPDRTGDAVLITWERQE